MKRAAVCGFDTCSDLHQRGAYLPKEQIPPSVVLWELGRHLGSLARRDLAARCREGRLSAKGKAESRRERKKVLTASCSSRWAGAITRTSNDAWALAERNLTAEAGSLRARVKKVTQRLAVPVGEKMGRTRGYASQAERWEKLRHLRALEARLEAVEDNLAKGRMSICRAGKTLARSRHNLEAAGLTTEQWRAKWEAGRLFITADGEADKAWGNETVRWYPVAGWLELKLPGPLSHLANRPHGRYRLSCMVGFPYRGDEVAAQAGSGAVRYDISHDSKKGRWYLDASWKLPKTLAEDIDDLRQGYVLGVDLNSDHLAAWVLDRYGNPVREPRTVPLGLAGLPATTRDGRLRAAISELVGIAKAADCRAIVVENVDFEEQRAEGREHAGRRPSRGKMGRGFRRLVSGIPTARLRHRLVGMATKAGLAVLPVDPAYTSKWGAEHWLSPLQEVSTGATGHHAAAVVIGRRGLGQRARTRGRCDRTPPEDGGRRATNSAVQPTGLAGGTNSKTRGREARGHLQRDGTGPEQSSRRPNQLSGQLLASRPKTVRGHRSQFVSAQTDRC